MMQTKSVLYAAVGAPVVAARKVSDKAGVLMSKVDEGRTNATKTAEKTIESWAAEGEKVVTRVSEGKTVEQISSKVDIDQAKEQMGKLRHQLEDMLETWRHSFQPEEAEKAEPKEEAAKKPAAKKEPAKKEEAPKPAASKKPATAKTSAAKTTKSKAAKTSPEKAEKVPEAKKAS